MRVVGFNGANTQSGAMTMTQSTDSVSKNIQNQIANAQKQLQNLASNDEMTIEKKMKKRQEIQKQIVDLNNQLRQHQIQQRKEKQQAKGTSVDDMLGGSKKTIAKAKNQSSGLSQASMKAMISADSSITQAQVQSSVATRMESRAGVLESEIKLDAGRGNVEDKKEELAEVVQKALVSTASQMNTLADVNMELEVTADQQTKIVEKKETKDEKIGGIIEEKQDRKVTGTEIGVVSELEQIPEQVVNYKKLIY